MKFGRITNTLDGKSKNLNSIYRILNPQPLNQWSSNRVKQNDSRN